jgi:signal transduction histidine kinase
LSREVVSSDRLIVRLAEPRAGTTCLLAIADPDQIEGIAGADPTSLERFDEWRGGSGLALAIARRVIGMHGGALFSPPGGGKAGALVMLPRA